MRIRSLAALALCAALASCGKSSGSSGLGLWQPASVAVFRGFTVKNPGVLHDYVAVANTARNELVLLDAVDDAPVLAPVLIRPLAVAVGEPRPTDVLSASLHDADVEQADLLVVRAAGSSVLQVVKTWSADSQVVPALDVDLAADAPDAEVLAMVAAPVPIDDGAGGWMPAPGRARVVAALSGQRLAVVEFTRQEDGSIAGGAPVVQDLALAVGAEPVRFDLVSLAVNQADPRFVYAASLDPIPTAIGTIEGVAELDATGAPGAWTWRALDARAPTRLVAAFTLRERLPESAGDGPDTFQPDPRPRVYAFLDPSRCGVEHRVGCGIAVIDPVAGRLLPDPAGWMPYMAPVFVPAIPVALAVSPPPVKPPSEQVEDVDFAAPYMRIAPGSGQRMTTGVLEVPSANGLVYFVDLARWAIPNDGSILRLSTTRTAVTSGFSSGDGEQRIGVWDVRPMSASPAGPPELALSSAALRSVIALTPGFTPSESWAATWQGVLPGLSLRLGETGPTGDGRAWLALQVRTADASGTERPMQVARVYDPSLGIHPGDRAVIATKGIAGCADVVEAQVAELGAPDALRPGGHLVLDEVACAPPATADATEDCSARDEYRACLPTLLAGQRGRAVTLYAGDMVVTGAAIGYAGRAPLATKAQIQATPNAPELQYRLEARSPDGFDEDELAAMCPLIPWPWPDPFPAAPPTVTCDADCRLRCEQLVLARKARRIYHVSDKCGDLITDATCNDLWAGLPFPKANGPAVWFRLGLQQDPTRPDAPIARGLGVMFVTRGGITPASRYPTSSEGATATLPLGAAVYDRSKIPGKERDGYRVYVPYTDGVILDFSPSQPVNLPVVIR